MPSGGLGSSPGPATALQSGNHKVVDDHGTSTPLSASTTGTGGSARKGSVSGDSSAAASGRFPGMSPIHGGHAATIPAWGRTSLQADSARGMGASQGPVFVATTAPPAQMPATVAVSPIMRTRSTACDMRGLSPHSGDTKRTAVRRFVSAGMSPRVTDTKALNEHRQAGWSMSTGVKHR